MNHKLIKRLLSNKLSVKERRSYADMESINKELKKQWDGAGNKYGRMSKPNVIRGKVAKFI